VAVEPPVLATEIVYARDCPVATGLGVAVTVIETVPAAEADDPMVATTDPRIATAVSIRTATFSRVRRPNAVTMAD
jgi:hypothetical protein